MLFLFSSPNHQKHMFSFPFQSFQFLASKAETIPKLLMHIMLKSKQSRTLPSHAWRFSFPLGGIPIRLSFTNVCRERAIMWMLLSQCPSQPAEFLEQKQVLSTLQTIPSPEQLGKYSISVSPTVWVGGRAELNLYVISLIYRMPRMWLAIWVAPSAPHSCPLPCWPVFTRPYSFFLMLQISSRSEICPQSSTLSAIPKCSLQPPYVPKAPGICMEN